MVSSFTITEPSGAGSSWGVKCWKVMGSDPRVSTICFLSASDTVIDPANPGAYTQLPGPSNDGNNVTVTGGSGTGATFNLTFP